MNILNDTTLNQDISYQFNVSHAVAYGVDEAIFLQNLIFWLRQNLANKKHFHDENVWTYNTLDAYTELFPFWTKKQIRRIIKSLIDQNVIIKAEHNQVQYDHTSWYAIHPEAAFLLKCPNGHIEGTEWAHRKGETGTPIPDTKPDTKPKKTTKKSDEGFDRFWDRYALKKGKVPALRAWKRLTIEEKREAYKNIDAFKKSCNDLKFLPHPATYLNQRRWEDDLTPTGNTGQVAAAHKSFEENKRREDELDERISRQKPVERSVQPQGGFKPPRKLSEVLKDARAGGNNE